MYMNKSIIFILVFFLNSCSQNFQNNGLSEKKLDNLKIEIGKTSKQSLVNKYGPPIFENIFNKNVIYYVSHNTSYKTFEKRKTDKLLVYEITLDNKNIVKKFKSYTEKDGVDIDISKKQDKSDFNFKMLWEDMINAMNRRKN